MTSPSSSRRSSWWRSACTTTSWPTLGVTCGKIPLQPVHGSFIQSFSGSLTHLISFFPLFCTFSVLFLHCIVFFPFSLIYFVFLPSLLFHSSSLGCCRIPLRTIFKSCFGKCGLSWGLNCDLNDFEYSVNRMNCLHSYGKYPSSGSQFALPSFLIPLLSRSIQTVRRILVLYHAKCWSSSWCLNYSWW